MKYETYCTICEKHKVKPTQVIADGNIKQILEDDVKHNTELAQIMLDQYLTVYYWKGKPADI